jgi:hypothetical protein
MNYGGAIIRKGIAWAMALKHWQKLIWEVVSQVLRNGHPASGCYLMGTIL